MKDPLQKSTKKLKEYSVLVRVIPKLDVENLIKAYDRMISPYWPLKLMA